MTANHIIFVRGGKTHETHPWMFFHLDPKNDFAVTGVPSPEYGIGSFLMMKPSYKLSYLDFPEGKLQVWNQWTPERGKNKKPKKPDHESDLEPTIHLRQSDMSIDKTKKLPSVLALYNYVKQQPKGSVVSLQVFSHGDEDELVIWRDSHEDIDIDKDDLTLPRDAHDTEFRRRDFFGNNPLATGAGGRRFAEAFSPQAFVKLWGCDYNSDHFTLIKRAGENPFNALEKFKQLARLSSYIDVVDTLYPLLLARRIRVPVWAAPLGWNTTPWLNKRTYTGKFPPNDLAKEWWWSVPNMRNKYLRISAIGLESGLDRSTRRAT